MINKCAVTPKWTWGENWKNLLYPKIQLEKYFVYILLSVEIISIMSLRKTLRRSLRSSYKVKSSDEGQMKPESSAKISTNDRSSRGSDVTSYRSVDDLTSVRVDSPGPSCSVTLEACKSGSFESHDDVVAASAYHLHSSGSDDDLTEAQQQQQGLDEASCPDSALYEFIFRACALMALENEELKHIIEQQQQKEDEKQEKSQEEEDEEDATTLPKQDTEETGKKSKKHKVRR